MKLKVLVILALVFGLCLFFSCEGPAGAPGIAGEDGTPGADGVKGPKGPDGDQGEQGDQGEKGDPGEVVNGQDGERGDQGPSVRLLGEQENKAALASLAGEAGSIDAWLINGELWIWSETDDPEAAETTAGSAGFWIKKGAIRGPQGPRGDDGPEGQEGASSDGISFALITFDFGENSLSGATVGSESTLVGAKIKEPSVPPKRLVTYPVDGLFRNAEAVNWIFDGWYNGVDKWDFDKPVEGPTHLVAKYTAPTEIDVSGQVGSGKIQKAINYIEGQGTRDPFVLYIGHDLTEYSPHVPITMGTTASARVDLTLRSTHAEPRLIKKDGVTGSLFTLGVAADTNSTDSQYVTLTLDNVVLEGTYSNTTDVPIVTVLSGAHFIMEEGSGVTGNKGPGVYLGKGGTFIMNGGEISNNINLGSSSSYKAGAVDITESQWSAPFSSFTMNGGKIINNGACLGVDTGILSVAHVLIDKTSGRSCNITINGGEISGNGKFTGSLAALKPAGEQYACLINNITTMTGGKIIDNAATMIVGHQINTMSGGEITGNTGTGRVAVAEVSTMTGGTIRGNTYQMGDVYVKNLANSNAKLGDVLIWVSARYNQSWYRIDLDKNCYIENVTGWTGTIDNINLLDYDLETSSPYISSITNWTNRTVLGTGVSVPMVNNQVGPLKTIYRVFSGTGTGYFTTANFTLASKHASMTTNTITNTWHIGNFGATLGQLVTN